jgi:hypothetical protein
MLALLGAHLLLQETRRAKSKPTPLTAPAEPAQLLVRQIVGNLRQSLGRHPDVEALALAAGDSTTTLQPFGLPPMLRASWDLLLEASLEWPQVFVPGSLAALVGERIWGEGSWLFWLDAKTDPVDRAGLWQGRARELLTTFATSQVTPTATPRAPGIAGAAWSALSHLAESAVKRAKVLFTSRARPPFPKLSAEAGLPTVSSTATFSEPDAPRDLTLTREAVTDEQRKQLASRLGIPLGSVNAWLEEGKQ